MKSEEIISHKYCDECKLELNSDFGCVHYDGFVQIINKNRKIINEKESDPKHYFIAYAGNDVLFCSLECAKSYLNKQNGIRYFYDDENVECPRETEHDFCKQCPKYDTEQLICSDASYWISQGYQHPKSFYNKVEPIELPPIITNLLLENKKMILLSLKQYVKYVISSEQKSYLAYYLPIKKQIRVNHNEDKKLNQQLIKKLLHNKTIFSRNPDHDYIRNNYEICFHNSEIYQIQKLKEFQFDFQLNKLYIRQQRQYFTELIKKIHHLYDSSLIYGNLLVLYASLSSMLNIPRYKQKYQTDIQPILNELLKFDNNIQYVQKIQK